MSRIVKRFVSATSRRNASAADACAEITERFGNKPISVRTQLFDANQAQLLSVALGRAELHKGISVRDSPPKDGTPIPPGYHLVYFTPSILEQDLGLDGTDRTVNPLSPYTRRMWAGGELQWSQDRSKFLRVGQKIHETTKIMSAVPKKLKSGDEMCVVGVEKSFENENGLALVDKRSWVFQKQITDARPPAPKPNEKPLPDGYDQHSKDFRQTDVTLFRFSALTFNGHKIHYSKPWCQAVEGHRDCVVHGPLNLIHILDFWRDTASDAAEDVVPESITYRAMSPLYVDEPYRLLLGKNCRGESSSLERRAEIWDSYGNLSMKGTILE